MCLQVYIIHRRDEFRASKVIQNRALANPKIEVKFCAEKLPLCVMHPHSCLTISAFSCDKQLIVIHQKHGYTI